MRFHLQDVKKSVQRRGGGLSVALHFLRPGELQNEIERLIAYHEQLVGQPQRAFALDEARARIGDYRLAHCLIATLSYWYQWRQRDWSQALQRLGIDETQEVFASPTQLRLALFLYVNEHYQGFLDTAQRTQALHAFAASCTLNVSDLEALLTLDSEEEALLERTTPQVPSAQEIATLYNQWTFEAALMQASSVYFVIDCDAFNRASGSRDTLSVVSSGVGTAIKRLCFLARKLGVYYDLAYEASQPALHGTSPMLLTLTLYGPQEVTGAPQQYGLRLARLCRMLLDYGRPKTGGVKKGQGALTSALIKAEATVHFLQRSYTFIMGAELLRLLAPSPQDSPIESNNTASAVFDSSIEESFAHAFEALARSQGVDGWHLEREPEPLLLKQSIFIPDFALTRAQRRIYVEVLGFWTPAYRERKVQKLQQLRGRNDLLLAIPIEAKDAFTAIANDFPIVYYEEQLSVTEVLQVLRSRYDDFAERLAQIDVASVRERVERQGIIIERSCYEMLHCYRRSELQQAAMRIVNADISFEAGVGLYAMHWMERIKSSFIAWLHDVASVPMSGALQTIRARWPEMAGSDDSTIETLLGMWSELRIRRDSIFEAVVELIGSEVDTPHVEAQAPMPEKTPKRAMREKRVAAKKRSSNEDELKATQGDLWEMGL